MLCAGALLAAQALPASAASDSQADAPDKTETVYVTADASGSAKETSVEVTLKNPGGKKQIEDFSTLKEIRNTEGDEEFSQEKDGTLHWENKGEDISYKGTTAQETPVTVKVTYYLDGREIKPEKLAGKSGEVTIRFDYENHTAQEVTVDQEARRSIVPMTAITAAFLSDDVFSDVQVTNGRLVSVEGQTMVVGYAFPGLEDALSLADYEETGDAEIPDYVEITAQAEEFELSFTATVVSNGLFAGLEEEELDDLDDFSSSMDELSDASEELCDGAAELLKATGTMQNYLKQYVDGARAVDEGTAALSEGLRTLSSQTKTLKSGADVVHDGIQAIRTALSQSDVTGQMTSLALQMNDYVTAVQSLTAAAQSELSAIDVAGAESAAESRAREQAAAAVEAALAFAEDLSEEQKQALRASIETGLESSIELSGVTEEMMMHVANASNLLSQLPSVDTSQSGGAATGDFNALIDSLEQLEEGSRQLSDGIAAFDAGVSRLSEGSQSLASGTAGLVTAGDTILDAFAAYADGMKTFRDGIETFDEDGIQKLGELGGDDLSQVLTSVKALRLADLDYDSFSGLAEGQSGEVRFIIETEEIE